MGLVYVPTFTIFYQEKTTIHVDKYTFRPMDGMGLISADFTKKKIVLSFTKVLFGNLQILLCVRIPSIGSNQAQILRNRKIQ